MTKDEESPIADAVRCFANNNTTLTKSGVEDLVQNYISLLPKIWQDEIAFKDSRPSKNCIAGFAGHHGLEYRAVQMIEDKRLAEVTMPVVCEHIAGVNAVLQRFNIKDPKYIFNLDQSGSSFAKMTGRSLWKGVGPKHTALIQSTVRTKGNLERVTVMPVVSAAGTTCKPVMGFPGKQAHFSRVKGEIQTLHSFLPPCYLYQRELPGVNTEIMYDWARHFVEETTNLRANRQHLLLILDGYGAHVQFQTLQLLIENNIIVIALPAYTSHVLQPLDVSVFSSYKSNLQKEIHEASRSKKVVDAFDIAHCINVSYSASLTAGNIMSGFTRTGIWDRKGMSATVEPLTHLFNTGQDGDPPVAVTLSKLMKSFSRQRRSLLQNDDVEESGTIRINTTTGAHMPSNRVLQALKLRNERRHGSRGYAKLRNAGEPADFKEPKADVRRLLELAPERLFRRRRLSETRDARRAGHVARAAASIVTSTAST